MEEPMKSCTRVIKLYLWSYISYSMSLYNIIYYIILYNASVDFTFLNFSAALFPLPFPRRIVWVPKTLFAVLIPTATTFREYILIASLQLYFPRLFWESVLRWSPRSHSSARSPPSVKCMQLVRNILLRRIYVGCMSLSGYSWCR